MIEKSKSFLKYSAIVSIIYGLILLNNSFAGIFVLILGFIILSYSESDDLSDKKVPLIILTVIQMSINPISGLFLILSLNELERERTYNLTNDSGGKIITEKEQVNPESKKIDLLLKLGVGMVFISGILFATTSWQLITDLIKLIVLVILGTLFLALSVFTEKKLNIKKTSVMYWFLSMSFYFAIVVGIGYFGLLGKELSYSGIYKDIMYGITYLVVAIISIISYEKYNRSSLLYITYLFVYIGIKELIIGTGIPEIFGSLFILLISMVINLIFNKEYKIYKFNNILSYYLVYETLKYFGTEYKTILSIMTILHMLNVTFIAKKSENLCMQLITIVCDYILIYFAVINCNFDYMSIIIMLFTMVLSLSIKYNILFNSKDTKTLNDVAFLVSTIITLFISFFYTEINCLVVASLYLIYNIVNLVLKKQEEVDYYTLPLSILFLGFSLGSFIDNIFNNFKLNYSILFLVLSLIYSIIYTFTNNEKKKIYIIYVLISIALATLYNLTTCNIITQTTLLLPLIYVFLTYNNEASNKDIVTALYVFLLVNIYMAIVVCSLFSISIINVLLTLIIFLILQYIFRKNDKLLMISNFANIVPLFHSIILMKYEYVYKIILINMLEFYILYLLLKYLCKNNDDNKLLSIFGVIFILLQVFFNNNAITGLYVGAVGIILIFIGFYNKKYDKLFIEGILVTIANILFQLRELWSQIPFYLYLLLGGLGIIAFVTYKEIKNNKK